MCRQINIGEKLGQKTDFNNDEDCEENERYGVTIYTGKERIIELATYPIYEEAQEAGIKKALEIILEKGA